jgi:hypothetical protein
MFGTTVSDRIGFCGFWTQSTNDLTTDRCGFLPSGALATPRWWMDAKRETY